jgi:hypothetical protein
METPTMQHDADTNERRAAFGWKGHLVLWPLALVAAAALALGAAGPRDDDDDDEEMPFSDAEIFFEFNTTDNDLGVQIFLDGEDWKKVEVDDPDGNEIVQIRARGILKELGITELRFESAEPSPEEVLALFPPGPYEFEGETTEGGELESTAILSDVFLPAPTFTPSGGAAVDPNAAVVEWDAPGAELVEVIIENEESGEVFDVIVAGTVMSLDVPPQFLLPGMEYKIEILAISENGNKTIAESTFVTL